MRRLGNISDYFRSPDRKSPIEIPRSLLPAPAHAFPPYPFALTASLSPVVLSSFSPRFVPFVSFCENPTSDV